MATQPVKAPAAVPKQPKSGAVVTGSEDSFVKKYAQWLVAAGVALVTFLFFKVCFENKFTNWDDLGYVITDRWIKDGSAEGFNNLFKTTTHVMGNYHPLTILTYWVEYAHYGLEPWIYHVDSVIAHVLCTLSVFLFVAVLTRRTVAAGVAALLFGLHPMHVESVAWVAGRKDLLYGMFYLLSCTTYLWYLRSEGSKKWLWYVLGIVFFAVSLMAKSVGVTLPVVLLLLDYFEKRKWNLMLLAEKLPHFALSITFGLLSIDAQKQIGALATLDVNFTFVERIALAGYAMCTYLWKALIPAGLSNFYPYPMKDEHEVLSMAYFIYPVIVLGIIFLVWRFARRNRVVVFGLLFMLVNLLLLLQLIPVGGAIISDRYTYIPYLGLFLIVGWLIAEYMETPGKEQTGKAMLGVVVAYSLVLGYYSSERCKVWYDAISLWNDDAAKHPESPIPYFYLGQEYYDRFEKAQDQNERKLNFDSCSFYFAKSIERKPDYLNPIVCLGELQRSTGQIDEAKKNYEKAIKINPKNESVYLGLAVIYSIKQQYDSADVCFKKAISLKEYFPEAHSNYANYYDILGKEDSALKEYAIAIGQNRDAYIPYMNRGLIYIKLGRWDDAIKDYNRALEIRPDYGEPYYQRARCYMAKGNKAQAKQDLQQAKTLKFDKMDAAVVQSIGG